MYLYQGHILLGPPDLAVEILSPSTRNFDETRKLRFYEAAGVPEYWIFDPDQREVRPFRLDAGAYVPLPPAADDTFHSAVLPGFVVDPEDLFARVDGQPRST